MKKEFSNKPELYEEQWPGEFNTFSWGDYLTAIPSPIFLISTLKSNKKPNACLQSWSTFTGDAGEFVCIIGSVSKSGHLYKSILESKECVLNFPSAEIYDKCQATIQNNNFEDDEIRKSGLTVEEAKKVNAPRIAECFLNIECEFLWKKEHFKESNDVVVCLKMIHIAMDEDYYDENKKGRYGKSGYIYNIHSPRNPENGEVYNTNLGILKKYKDINN